MTGHSFAGILDDPDAPAANTVQYFEMMGSRAIVSGEWKAVCKHMPGNDFHAEQWELYHLASDWSECNDQAAAQPERLAAMIELWWAEAERHGVLPLDDRTIELFGARFRPNSPHPVDRHYVYRPPMSPLPGQAAAAIGGTDFDLTARISRTAGQDGVLFATGTENSGIAAFVQDDRFVVDYNAFNDHNIIESTVPVPAGDSTLVARFRRGAGRAGSISLEVDGQRAGTVELPLLMMMISSVGASIGYNHGSAVSERYEAPFAFGGTLHSLEIQLIADDDPAAQQARAAAEMSRQ